MRITTLATFIFLSLSITARADDRICDTFLHEERIDPGTHEMVAHVYNRLATDLQTVELKEQNSDDEIDVVNEFNAGKGMPENPEILNHTFKVTVSRTAPKLTLIALDYLDDHDDPVSYGLARGTQNNSSIIQQSQRIEALGRLSLLAQSLSDVDAKGNNSRVEFAKMYRGTEAIKRFMNTLSEGMKLQVKKTVVYNRYVNDDDNDHTFFGIPYPRTPSTIASIAALEAIWGWPGGFGGVDWLESVIPISQYINQTLTSLMSFIHPMTVALSPQIAYSVASLGTIGLTLGIPDVVKYIKYRNEQERLANQPPVVHSQVPQKQVPLITPIAQQFELVLSLLKSVADGEHVLGSRDLVSWATNYEYKYRDSEDEDFDEEQDMAFDLLLFMDHGVPVVIAVNRVL